MTEELAIPPDSVLANTSTAPIVAPAQRGRRRWRGCALRGLLVLAMLGGAAGLTLKLFGDTLVPPVVDAVRAVIGPEAMAEIEAHYYGFVETTHQWQRDLGLAPKVAAPWVVHTPAARRPAAAPPGVARTASGSFGPGWPPAPAALPPPTVHAARAPATLPPRPVAARPSALPTATAVVLATALPTEVAGILTTLPSTLPPTSPTAAHPTRTPRRAVPTHTRVPRRTASPTAPPTAEAAVPTRTAQPTATVVVVTAKPTATPAVVAAQPTATEEVVAAVPTANPVVALPTPVLADPSGSGQLAAPPPLADEGPPPLYPIIQDGGMAGEGLWTADGLPAPPDGGAPAFWKTYLRPDAARPDSLVYMVRFDPRRVRLHMVAGTQEPVSPYGTHGSGQVALADMPNLAVAFNGGWKSVHGNYGMMASGRQIAPPNPRDDTATLAIHAGGRVELGAWKTLRAAQDLVSYRQNCPLLIDNGVSVVQGHIASTWGLSILSEMYVWRSGVGITADGYLIYAAGSPISADELAVALQQAGAVYAMQLDINSAFVHWLNYTGDGKGKLHADPLVPGMAYRRDDYLTPGQRDFFYLTWK